MENRLKAESGQQFLTDIKALQLVEFKRLQSLSFIRRHAKSSVLFFRGVVETRFRMSVHHVLFVARVEENGLNIISPLTEQLQDGTWKVFK